MTWIQTPFPEALELGNRMVFGVIREARVIDPGISAFFIIVCSDGTIIEDKFVFTLNPCDAVGGLVQLELSTDNRVGQRRFKVIDDMRATKEALRAAILAKGKRKEREEDERQVILRPLIEEIRQRRRTASFMMLGLYDREIERLEKMSLKSLKKLMANKRAAEVDNGER